MQDLVDTDIDADTAKYRKLARVFYKKRSELGLTSKQVASMAGVDAQAVLRFENCQLVRIHPHIELVASVLRINLQREEIPEGKPHGLTSSNKTPLGELILKTRISRGHSQESFGKIMGVARCVISEIERGNYKPGLPQGFIERFERFRSSIS